MYYCLIFLYGNISSKSTEQMFNLALYFFSVSWYTMLSVVKMKKEILTHAGTISVNIAKQYALSEFEKYCVRQDQLYQRDFDRILWMK